MSGFAALTELKVSKPSSCVTPLEAAKMVPELSDFVQVAMVCSKLKNPRQARCRHAIRTHLANFMAVTCGLQHMALSSLHVSGMSSPENSTVLLPRLS